MIQQHIVIELERAYTMTMDEVNEAKAKLAGAVANNPLCLSMACYSSEFKYMFALESLMKPDLTSAVDYLKYSVQSRVGYYKTVTNDKKPITIEFDGQKIETTGAYSEDKLEIYDWVEDFQDAVICRDSAAIHYLMQVNPEVHVRKGGREGFELFLACAELYKGFFSRNKNLRNLLERARRAYVPNWISDPDQLRMVQLVYLPQLDVLEVLINSGSEQDYNRAVESALLKHQTYWLEKDPEVDEGGIAFHLLAIAVIAHDAFGRKVTVDKSYIPAWIVENRHGDKKLDIQISFPVVRYFEETELDSAKKEKALLSKRDLDGQINHIDFYLDYFFCTEDPVGVFKAFFPHLWQLYLCTLPYQAGEGEQALTRYLTGNLDSISEELTSMRQTFVGYKQKKATPGFLELIRSEGGVLKAMAFLLRNWLTHQVIALRQKLIGK